MDEIDIEERFEILGHGFLGGTMSTFSLRIILDKETGRKYLCFDYGYKGGICELNEEPKRRA